MTQSIATLIALIALQLSVFKVAQQVLSDLYYSTSQLFDSRSEVKGAAILFRLSIPFFAGVLAALILARNEIPVAAGSGALTWFLIIWPIAWAPSLMLSHSKRWPIVLLLLGFWGAFALLPIAGVAATNMIVSAVQGKEIDWGLQFMLAAFTGIPISVTVGAFGRLANRRVSFAEDSEEEVEGDEDISDESSENDPLSLAYALGICVCASFAAAVAGYLLARRRGR